MLIFTKLYFHTTFCINLILSMWKIIIKFLAQFEHRFILHIDFNYNLHTLHYTSWCEYRFFKNLIRFDIEKVSFWYINFLYTGTDPLHILSLTQTVLNIWENKAEYKLCRNNIDWSIMTFPWNHESTRIYISSKTSCSCTLDPKIYIVNI